MTYLIGEIGQNHNGSVDVAKAIIDVVARPVYDKLFETQLGRMNAVKLTKRDLQHELSASQMARPYNSPHSFGKTYGEHRAYLELDDAQHFEIYQYAKKKGLDFVETLCAINCLSILDLFVPDRLKVASRDVTNLPLLDELAKTRIPIIISTGMAGERELNNALNTITKHHEDISILHCVSQYPTHYENVNLNTIPYLKEKYPNYTIGYSDHTVGIATPVAAVAMGAEIIEKHITLDRQMKGTDQAGSLEIDGIFRMTRDIRNLEISFGTKEIKIEEVVKEVREKLERSIATQRALPKGHIITEDDIHLLSPGDGFQWAEKEYVIGKRVTNDIPKDEIIYKQNFQ
ncbi:shikimate dehydrogenase [Rasiella rasia]|uniref:Shikimate dehydrogenase n=1 Tax=Rasiella rasia TaxID=2744027 RepID=A0A6G6GQC8_9FLAO|nr:N-acetylneuraminate synthase family protein [Rasiella rasia]QIE59921.1 shikimate dehydrogenase [Rasiella rasia]